MVRQQFNVDGYWEVVVYYNIDYRMTKSIYLELLNIGFPKEDIDAIIKNLKSGDAWAVTCSNGAMHKSIVLFNKHKTKEEYISSLVHEAEHVKQAMLNTYMVEDMGEPPAYTIGYLVKRMWEGFNKVGYKI